MTQAEAHLIPGATFCLVEHEPWFFHEFWTPILVYHTVMVILFIAKGWMVYSELGQKRWKSTGLLAKIYKDSLVNFLA